jgi:hypothetical protein
LKEFYFLVKIKNNFNLKIFFTKIKMNDCDDLEARKNRLRQKFLKYSRQIAREQLLNNLSELTPENCIEILENFLLDTTKTSTDSKIFFKLRKKFQLANREWLENFIKLNGLLYLLNLIDNLLKIKLNNLLNTLKLIECIECIKEIMNKRYGMNSINDLILNDIKYITILTKG